MINPMTTVRTIDLGTTLFGELTSSVKCRQASRPVNPKQVVTRLVKKHTPSDQPVRLIKVFHTNTSGALSKGRTMSRTVTTTNIVRLRMTVNELGLRC